MKTSIDGLDEAIKAELEGWASGDLRRAINEGMEEAAEAAENVPGKPGRCSGYNASDDHLH